MVQITPHRKLSISQIIIHAVCIIGMYLYWDPAWLLVSVVGTLLIGSYGLGIYGHRYLAHRSFKMHPRLEPILNILAVLALQGSPMTWAANHVTHHRYSDKKGDPHPSKNWFRTWFWLGMEKDLKIERGVIKRLSKNKMHRWTARHYFKIYWGIILTSVLIDPRITIYFFAFPVVYTFHTSSFTNVILHKFGYRSFDTNDKSTNLWIPILLESNYHNNHHKYPANYNQAIKWYEWDFYANLVDIIKVK